MLEVILIFTNKSKVISAIQGNEFPGNWTLNPIDSQSLATTDEFLDYTGQRISKTLSQAIVLIEDDLYSEKVIPHQLESLCKTADKLFILYHTYPDRKIIEKLMSFCNGETFPKVSEHSNNPDSLYYKIFELLLKENTDYSLTFAQILEILGVDLLLEAKLTLLHSLLDQKVDMDSLWDRLVSRCNDLLQYETVWVEYVTSIRTDSKTWNEALTVLRDSILK